MGSRRQARILAFQSMYSWDLNPQKNEDLLSFRWLDEEKRAHMGEEILQFAGLLVSVTLEHLEQIDGLIREHLEHWDFSRLSKVELAILRISAAALLFYQDSIPASVTIDEAIDIAKDFGSDESYRFINGVLDAIHKRLQNDSPAGG